MNEKTGIESQGECSDSGCGCDTSRRRFLQVIVLGAMGSMARADAAEAMAGPFDDSDFARLVPPDKKLSAAWIRSLFERGESTVYQGDDLARIGMPVGGLCAGQLYLGGDGKLWHWDIFNRVEHTNEAHYAQPMRPGSPLDQGFAVRIKHQGKTDLRTLDRAAFRASAFAASTRSAWSLTRTRPARSR